MNFHIVNRTVSSVSLVDLNEYTMDLTAVTVRSVKQCQDSNLLEKML